MHRRQVKTLLRTGSQPSSRKGGREGGGGASVKKGEGGALPRDCPTFRLRAPVPKRRRSQQQQGELKTSTQIKMGWKIGGGGRGRKKGVVKRFGSRLVECGKSRYNDFYKEGLGHRGREKSKKKITPVRAWLRCARRKNKKEN